MSKTVDGVTTLDLVDDLNPSGYPQVLAEYSPVTSELGGDLCLGSDFGQRDECRLDAVVPLLRWGRELET